MSPGLNCSGDGGGDLISLCDWVDEEGDVTMTFIWDTVKLRSPSGSMIRGADLLTSEVRNFLRCSSHSI